MTAGGTATITEAEASSGNDSELTDELIKFVANGLAAAQPPTLIMPLTGVYRRVFTLSMLDAVPSRPSCRRP